MEYLVIYEEGPTGWSAYDPDLPGCVGAAKTREEIETLMQDAIEFHIEGLKRRWNPIPKPAWCQ